MKNFQQNFIARHCKVGVLAYLLALSTFLLFYYEPAWQSNDDTLRNMLFNGFGVARFKSDAILNSNYFWVKLVQLLPDFWGYSNYTLFLYFFSILSVCLIWLSMYAAQPGRLVPALLLTSMLFYNILNPQYTVTAAYCAIAAISCFLAAIRSGQRVLFMAGAFVMSLAGFIIRDLSFLMMAILGIFACPWKQIMASRRLMAFAAILLASLAFIYFFDVANKSGSENWPEIKIWDNARRSLADSDIVSAYLEEPALLKKLRLSPNDMRLLGNDFSLAPDLRDTDRLGKLKRETDGQRYIWNKIVNANRSVEYLFSWPVCLLLGVCVILFIQRFSWKNLMGFLLLFAIFYAIGLLNRGGSSVARLYYTPLYLLALCMLLTAPNNEICDYIWINPALGKILVSILLLFSIHSFSKANLVDQWRYQNYDLKKTARLMDGAIWAGYPFRIEKIYAPFRKLDDLKKISFQSSAWSALLPASTTLYDIFSQADFASLLSSGFKYAATEEQVRQLAVYCSEHLRGELHSTLLSPPECFPVYSVICQKEGRK